MKAIVRTQYGSPDELQFAKVPTPSPAGNEVLTKLCAASVNPVDLFVLQGAPWNRIPGLRAKPKYTIIGCDIAGRVEAVGRNVTQFQAADDVFGTPRLRIGATLCCGLLSQNERADSRIPRS
jgi:NADPH:quinone reductase-like Zn-dependent oxidoreductase